MVLSFRDYLLLGKVFIGFIVSVRGEKDVVLDRVSAVAVQRVECLVDWHDKRVDTVAKL